MSKAENLTPERMRCMAGGCSSLHRLEDGRFLVVGPHGDTAAMEAGVDWHSRDQSVVIVDDAPFDTYVEEKVREEREALARAGTVMVAIAHELGRRGLVDLADELRLEAGQAHRALSPSTQGDAGE